MGAIKELFYGAELASQSIETTKYLEAQAQIEAMGRLVAVIEFELDGTIITANDCFLQAMGYALGEIQGKHHSMFVEPEYAQSNDYQEFWAALRKGKFQTAPFKRFGKNNKEVWIQASYSPLFDADGKPYKVVKYAMDITETKRINENATQMMNMVENMPIAVLYVDRDLVIRYMNPASLQVLKRVEYALPMPVDQIVGQCIDVFHKNPEYQRKLLADPANLPITTQIQVGKEKMSFDVSAIMDSKGQYMGAMASGRIITEELKTKEEARTVGQSVASSATQMAASIDEISKNVSQTASLAQDAEDHAKASAESTHELQESSRAIGQVVGVIQELADQTNLLALNATIEAARAGESGRSFAVVASEVKELAQETNKATQSIEKSVLEIQSRIDDVTGSITKISESVSEVSGNTITVAAAIEEQSVTMGELSSTADGLVQLADKA